MTDERSESEEQWESDERLESMASGDEPLGLHANIKPPRREAAGDEASRGVLDRLLRLVGVRRRS
jgi:hypothetical protein